MSDEETYRTPASVLAFSAGAAVLLLIVILLMVLGIIKLALLAVARARLGTTVVKGATQRPAFAGQRLAACPVCELKMPVLHRFQRFPAHKVYTDRGGRMSRIMPEWCPGGGEYPDDLGGWW